MKFTLALIGFVLATTAAMAGSTPGFQIVSVPDPQGPTLTMGVWYPTTAAPSLRRIGLAQVSVATGAPVDGAHLPLIILSHGQQGAVGSHADTAIALAEAGFVVAAPVHTGDNFEDQSAVGGPKWFADRTRHIAAAIDYMLTAWPSHHAIDADRIGIFGFSAGGTTALMAIGGVPDFAGIPATCQTSPEFACSLWTGGAFAQPTRDLRLKAAVVAAPGFGFAFLPDGLKSVHAPVQIWSGDADTNVPARSNAAPLAKALSAQFHLVPGAQHFSFIVPCQGPPICNDAPDFDRAAFHRDFNAAVVQFFAAKLK